jgi:hypothetical protein
VWWLQRLGVIGLGQYPATQEKYLHKGPHLVTLLEDVEWRSHSTYMTVIGPVLRVRFLCTTTCITTAIIITSMIIIHTGRHWQQQQQKHDFNPA